MKNNNSLHMKRLIAFYIILLLLPGMKAVSQNKKMENLNSFKIGFFTKKLDLSPAEAEKFWPVYNEYQNQRSQIQLEKISVIRNFNLNEATLSDRQLTEMGDKLVSTVTRESALSVNLHNKLKEILPPAKVIRFYQAENQYKAQLLNELQGTRQGQGQGQKQGQKQGQIPDL
jgi:hypothetical protein